MARTASPSVFGSLALVASLALAGCLKANDVVVVKPDGSGTFSTTVTIDLSAMKGIAEAMGGAPDAKPDGEPGEDGKGKKDDPLEEMKEEWKHIEGIEIVKADSVEKDGKVTMTIDAKFKTLEAYARATSIEMGATLEKQADGSYVLRFDDKPGKPDPAGEGAKGGEGEPGAPAPGADDFGAEMAAGMMSAFEPFLKGIEMTRKLTLPGKIVTTNGVKSDDGSTVTWTVKWDDIKKAKKPPAQSVTFRGDDLTLKPFSITRERAGGGMPPAGDE